MSEVTLKLKVEHTASKYSFPAAPRETRREILLIWGLIVAESHLVGDETSHTVVQNMEGNVHHDKSYARRPVEAAEVSDYQQPRGHS
jgi:hypothetical protein